MNYSTIPPNVDLEVFVKCYWTLDSNSEEELTKQRIVPDGCMEMIFHHGDLYRQYLDNGHSIIQPRSFVFGQITTALEIQPTGRTGIFAIRFLPDGFEPFLTIPISEMENKAVSLGKLFGDKGIQLEENILLASNNKQRVQIIEGFLRSNLITTKSIDRIIKSSISILLNSRGDLSVKNLSETVQINRRKLERKFSSTVGLSPKQLAKIVRLQATLKMLMKEECTSLTSLAFEGNYYDQTHFIKDFKEFTGVTPKHFYTDYLKMSSLFIDCD